MVLAVADQVGAAHALQRLAQQRPVVGVVVAQERLVQAPRFSPRTMSTVSLSRVTLRSGFLPVWYIAVAVAIGQGKKVCTWSARKPFFLSHSARFIMSSSLVPGCAAMKYGIRYCFLPASCRVLVEQRLELVVAADAGLHHLR